MARCNSAGGPASHLFWWRPSPSSGRSRFLDGALYLRCGRACWLSMWLRIADGGKARRGGVARSWAGARLAADRARPGHVWPHSSAAARGWRATQLDTTTKGSNVTVYGSVLPLTGVGRTHRRHRPDRLPGDLVRHRPRGGRRGPGNRDQTVSVYRGSTCRRGRRQADDAVDLERSPDRLATAAPGQPTVTRVHGAIACPTSR